MKFVDNQNMPKTGQNPGQPNRPGNEPKPGQPNRPGSEPKEGTDKETEKAG